MPWQLFAQLHTNEARKKTCAAHCIWLLAGLRTACFIHRCLTLVRMSVHFIRSPTPSNDHYCECGRECVCVCVCGRVKRQNPSPFAVNVSETERPSPRRISFSALSWLNNKKIPVKNVFISSYCLWMICRGYSSGGNGNGKNQKPET